MKKLYIIIGIIILILIIGGGKEQKKQNDNNENTIIKIPNGIQVIEYKKTNITIDTIIKNNTGKEIKTIKITAECYDKNKNNLGKYTNGQNNINTIDNYKITIYCPIETSSYKLYIENE